MADTKISALTELTATPANTDEFAINDGGTSKRLQAQRTWLTVYKTADEAITSDDTLTDDADLQFPVDANGIYAVFMFIWYETVTTTPDFKYAFSIPTGAVDSGQIGANNWRTTSTPCTESPWTTVHTMAGTGDEAFPFVGQFTNGVNAGTLAMKWAQATSDVNATTLKLGSWLMYKKLN